jgi:hypothetical protein
MAHLANSNQDLYNLSSLCERLQSCILHIAWMHRCSLFVFAGSHWGWTFFSLCICIFCIARFACKEPGVDAPFVGAASQCDSRGWWECIASAQYCECSWESGLVEKKRHLALSVTRFASRVHILLLIFIFPMKLAMLPPPLLDKPLQCPYTRVSGMTLAWNLGNYMELCLHESMYIEYGKYWKVWYFLLPKVSGCEKLCCEHPRSVSDVANLATRRPLCNVFASALSAMSSLDSSADTQSVPWTCRNLLIV